MGVSLEQLIGNISKLPDMEAEHPGIVSAPLLQYIHTWLSFGDNHKLAGLSELRTMLADAQGAIIAERIGKGNRFMTALSVIARPA